MAELVTQIGKAHVLHVMAAEQEYGPHLKELITPLICGVGPIEAAIALTRFLARVELVGKLPDLVISLGSAGSATLHQAEIYQANSISWRDMDATALGFIKGVTPFVDLPAEIPLDHLVDGIAMARLSTGANIVSGKVYQAIDADMVDMESFALLRACQQFGIAFIGLRGISDGADEIGHIDDLMQYLHIIDEKMATALRVVHRAIETDQWQGRPFAR